MGADSYYLIGIIVAALLAVANGWRGVVLFRLDRRADAIKRLLYSAAMIVFMVALVKLRSG